MSTQKKKGLFVKVNYIQFHSRYYVRHTYTLSHCPILRASLVAQSVKNLPAVKETWIWFPGQEDSLEKEMATHCSILAWEIPCTEAWQATVHGVTRVGHNLVTKLPHDTMFLDMASLSFYWIMRISPFRDAGSRHIEELWRIFKHEIWYSTGAMALIFSLPPDEHVVLPVRCWGSPTERILLIVLCSSQK